MNAIFDIPKDRIQIMVNYLVSCYDEDLESPLMKELQIAEPVQVLVMYVW